MNMLQISSVSLLATLSIGHFAASSAAADTVMRQIAEDKVMITDFAGKPPFRRRIVDIADLGAAELARFEALDSDIVVDSARIGETVRRVDFRGKPPFRRSTVQIDEANAVEFARLEEVADEPAERPRRRGAPGKGHPIAR